MARVPPLNPHVPITDAMGRPTSVFLRWIQDQISKNGSIVPLTNHTEVSTVLDYVGASRGAVLYRGASLWSALNAGTSGYVLTTQGPGADPVWALAASNFLALSDTPSNYSGSRFKVPAVKFDQTGLEFVDRQTIVPNVSEREFMRNTWTLYTTGISTGWLDITWAPELGIFCAVGFQGTGTRVMTSPDGRTWTGRTEAATNQWAGVAWSPELSLFVAVATTGTGNRIMTSPDGITWTSRTNPIDNNWRGVCWSAELGIFVAVANSGTSNQVMTSPDGITWTSRSAAAANTWFDVCWSPELSLFVAVSDSGAGNRVMTSPDGITWTSRTSAADNNWRRVIWVKELGLFVTTSASGIGNRIMTSPDGITWTARTSPADNNWADVGWSPELGLLVSVASTPGTGNRVMTSTDGVNWQTQASAADANWISVAWSPQLGIFCSISSTTGVGVQNSVSAYAYPWLGGSGAPSFTGLTDTPSVYTGQAAKVVSVKADETGLEFTTPAAGSGGAWTLISRQVLGASAASVTFSAIPTTYHHLKLITVARGDTASTATALLIQFNGDTAANYRSDRENRFGATAGANTGLEIGQITAASLAANYAAMLETLIADYLNTTFYKNSLSYSHVAVAASPYSYAQNSSGYWLNTAAINQITIFPVAGNIIAGSTFSLYGIN